MANYDIDKVMQALAKPSAIPTTPTSGVSFAGPTAPVTPIAAPNEGMSTADAIGTVGSPLGFFPGVYKGIKYGLPGLVADSAQLLGMESAKGVSEWAKEGLGTEPKTWMEAGGEAVPTSGGVQIFATALGAALQLVPHPATKAAGMFVSRIAPHITPILFGLSAGQATKEAIEERRAKGIDIEDSGSAISKVVAINWLGETIGNTMIEKALGKFAIIPKISKSTIASMGIAETIKGSPGAFLKNFALKVLPTEIATESAQNYLTASVEQGANIRPDAQPGLEALAAVGPTTVMTAAMSALGLAARGHIANRQAEILARPVPPKVLAEDKEAAETWKDLRIKIAKNIEDQIEDPETKLQWKTYSDGIIANNKTMRLEKSIGELINPKVPVNAELNKDVDKAQEEAEEAKEPLTPEAQRAADIKFLTGIGAKLAKKKKKLTDEEVNTLMLQEGKSESFKNVADYYLKAFGYQVVNPLRARTGVDAFKPPEITGSTIDTSVLSDAGRAELENLTKDLPSKAKVVDDALSKQKIVRTRPEEDVRKAREKLIVAARGTKESPAPLTPIPVESYLKDYETALETMTHTVQTGVDKKTGEKVIGRVSNPVIIDKKTKQRFEVVDYETSMVSQGKGKKKKEVVSGLLVLPKLDLPEPGGPEGMVRPKKMKLSEIQKIIESNLSQVKPREEREESFESTIYMTQDKVPGEGEDIRLTQQVVPAQVVRKLKVPVDKNVETKEKLTLAGMIRETAKGSGEYVYPQTADELISLISKKKAEGVDVNDIVGELSKVEGDRTPDTFIPRYLEAIVSAVNKRITDKAYRAKSDLPKVKEYRPAKKGIDFNKALAEGAGYSFKDSSEGLVPVTHRDDSGKEIPTVYETLTAAENRAKELNYKFGLKAGEKFQKNKPLLYRAGVIKIETKDAKGKIKKVDRYVVQKLTKVYQENVVAEGKKSSIKSPMLLKGIQLFEAKLKDSAVNSLAFVKDVIIPHIEARLENPKFSRYNLEATDEVAEYLGGRPPKLPLAAQQQLTYHRLLKRYNEFIGRNYDLVGQKTTFFREKGRLKSESTQGKEVLKPESELTMIDPSGVEYLKLSDMIELLDDLTKTKSGWEALNKFDAEHGVPGKKGITRSMIGLEIDEAAKQEKRSPEEVEALLKKIEEARKAGDKVVVPSTISDELAKHEKRQQEIREHKETLKKEVAEEKVITNREIEAVSKNKTLKKLIASVIESGDIQETVNPTNENPTIANKIARMLTKFGKQTIETWHAEAQADVEDAGSERAYNRAIASRDFFNVNVEPSKMDETDVIKLAAIHDYMIDKKNKVSDEKLLKHIIDAGKATNRIQELSYQNADLLGMGEDQAYSGIKSTSALAEKNKEKDVSKMTLEELVNSSEPIPDTLARGERGTVKPKKKSKKASKTAEQKVADNIDEILNVAEDSYEGFAPTSAYTSDTYTDEEDYEGLYNSEPRDMARPAMENLSEYIGDHYPSSTFNEFKLSMYNFLGKTWDRVKYMAKYLWDRLRYTRGDAEITTLPRFMARDKSRDGRLMLDYGDNKDIPTLWETKIKPDLKSKAKAARDRFNQTQDPADLRVSDNYLIATNFNVLSTSNNKRYYTKIFDFVLNNEWVLPKKVFADIKSYLTKQKLADIKEVRANMQGVTKVLVLGPDFKYTAQSIHALKTKVIEDLSPWMFSSSNDIAFDKARASVNRMFAAIDGPIKNVLQMSKRWFAVNDNKKTKYLAREFTPAYKSFINNKFSEELGIAFDVDTAIGNPKAYGKMVKVRMHGQRINLKTVVPTVDISTANGSSVTLRKIDGSWYSVFFATHLHELFNVGTIEDMKAIDKAESEGVNNVTSTPKDMSIGRIGFSRLIQSVPDAEKALAIANYEKAVAYAEKHGIDSMRDQYQANEKMRAATGWYKNLEGKWSYEISDQRIEFTVAENAVDNLHMATLKDVADISHLTKLYDKANTLTISFVTFPPLANGKASMRRGEYLPKENHINISKGLKAETRLNTLTHELQHFVQDREKIPGKFTDITTVGEYGNRLIDEYNQKLRRPLSQSERDWVHDKINGVKALQRNINAKIDDYVSSAIQTDLYWLESNEVDARISATRRKLSTRGLRETPIRPRVLVKGIVKSTDSYVPNPLSLDTLQKLLPAATITKLDDSGERFDVQFTEGFVIRIEGMKVVAINGEEVKWGNWQFDNGTPLMRIAGTAQQYTQQEIGSHEIVHMIADIFMTREEQNMMLAQFAMKGENEDATWERIANHTINRTDGGLPELQRSYINTLRYKAKQMLYWLKDLIFGAQVKSYRSPDALFNAIRNGEITTRPAQLNLTDANKSRGYVANYTRYGLPVILTSKGTRKVNDPNLRAKEKLIASQTNRDFKLLATMGINSTVDGEIPYNLTLMDRMKDYLGGDQKAAWKNNLQPLMKWYENIFSNPLFKAGATIIDRSDDSFNKMERGEPSTYGQRILKYPAWAGATFIERARFHENTNRGVEYMKATETYHRLKHDDMLTLDPVFKWGNLIENHRYLTEAELRDPKFMKQVYVDSKTELPFNELSEDAITGYLEVVEYMKKMHGEIINHAEAVMIKPYMNSLTSKEYAELQRLYSSLIKGNHPAEKTLEKLFAKKEFNHIDPVSKRKTNRLKDAYNKLDKKLNDVRRERAKIGTVGGYVPMRREPSPNFVSVKMIDQKDGSKQLVQVYPAFGDAHADRLKNALMEEYPELADTTKYDVSWGRSSKPSDSTFFMVGDMNTTRVIDLAISKLTANQTLDIKEAHDLSNSIYDSVSDIMKARGAGMSAIQRKFATFDKKLHNIEGYIDQDFRKIIDGYVNGYIGMQTKFNAATKYMELLKTTKANTQMYDQISEYAKNNLRNMDEWDRRVGKIKGFMFHFYLAGKLSVMFLQLTQNFITAIPLMATKMHAMGLKGGLNPEKIMIGAMRDGFSDKRLSDNEREMLQFAQDRGDTMAQYLQEINIAAMGSGNKLAATMLKGLAWPMKASEEWNRRVAILGYYRMLTQKAGYDPIADKDKIYAECEDFMYNSHWWYSKANLPKVAHGGTEFARLSNLAYTFRPFTHHYVLSLAYNFLNHGGTGGLIYAARSFAWIAILGGVPAIPWIDDFIELVEKWTGEPIRIKARRSVEKLASTSAARFTGAGLAGVVGIDMSAAMRPAGIPGVGDWSQSVFGVYSGIAGKFDKFIDEMRLGEFARAFESASPVVLENIFKAYRLYEKGPTTSAKNPVYYKGEPFKLNTQEAILQGMGLKNLIYSNVLQDEWEMKVVAGKFNDQKSRIIKQQHLAKTYEERDRVMAKMIDFNLSIPPALIGVVTPFKKWSEIKPASKKSMIYQYNIDAL